VGSETSFLDDHDSKADYKSFVEFIAKLELIYFIIKNFNLTV
jgi:hypothetical protein